MRHCCLVVGCLIAFSASAQTGAPETPQFRKLIALSKTIAVDLEKRDGSLNNAAVLTYVQTITDRIAAAAQVKPLQVHITRGNQAYAMPLMDGSLYLSATLLENLQNESELAGLLAHELAHDPSPLPLSGAATIPVLILPCVLADGPALGQAASRRDTELTATRTAMEMLRTTGYEPSAVLDLFSRLSYNHPNWAKALNADDILALRLAEESTLPPAAGYAINTSAFDEHWLQVLTAMGHAPKLVTSSLRSSALPIVR